MDQFKSKKILMLALAVFLSFSFVHKAMAFTLQPFEYQFELRRIGVEAEDLDGSSSSAVWTNAIAFRAPFLLGDGPFYLVPGLSLTTLHYYYDTTNEIAVVTDMEWRELTTLVPQFDTTIRWVFADGKKGSYSFETGLCLSLPIPVKNWSGSSTSGQIIPAIYSSGGIIMPLAALQASWPVFGERSLLARLATHLPIYRGWDGSGLPMTDGLLLGVSIGLIL